jgi:ATP-dependent RNA helicase DDX42
MSSGNPFGDEVGEGIEQYEIQYSNTSDFNAGDIDPLDAFMNDLHEESTSHFVKEYAGSILEEFDNDEDYPAETTSRASAHYSQSDEAGGAKRQIDNLPEIDHSTVDYPPFRRDLYREHETVSSLSDEQVADLRRTLGVSVSGRGIPACICSFGHLGLPESIMSVLRFLEFTSPTPIQSQAIPALLSGRDVMGIATTGSGKTMAFLIPAIVHILENERQSTPRSLVLCPTRELAVQIEQEAYRFSKKSHDMFTTVVLTGGLSKYEQLKELRRGASLIVGNPGRILDLIQMKKGLDLSNITYCILDESDRMFNMGFEQQLRLIMSRIRPDRQIGLFSATMPPRIEKLSREIMTDPIRIVVGEIGQVTDLVDQKVHVVSSEDAKFSWLEIELPLLVGGRMLIFVNSKTMIDSVIVRVKHILSNISCRGLSSDMDQATRLEVMAEFRSGVSPILVATDIAARGLHIDNVTCVIEFEVSQDYNLRVHRIGRAGRAGQRGTSWTLLTQNDARMAAHITEGFEAMGKPVSEELMGLALKHAPFRAAHMMRQSESEPWDGIGHHFEKKQKLVDGGE